MRLITALALTLVFVSLRSQNTPLKPTANGDSINVGFESTAFFTLTGADPNSPPLNLTFGLVTATSHGSVNIGTDGKSNYTPQNGFHGADSFEYTVTNSAGLISDPAMVSINVDPGAPTPMDQSVSVPYNATSTIYLTSTDPNVPSLLPLTYYIPIIANNPSHGTISYYTVDPYGRFNGTFYYTPTSGFTGTDSLIFDVLNEGGRSSGYVTLTITVLGNKPVATPQSVTVPFNTTITIVLYGVDNNKPPLDIVGDVATLPLHGTLVSSVNSHDLDYTPDNGYNGADSFTFTVKNSQGQVSDPATVSITVQAGKPVIYPQKVTTPFNTQIRIDMNATDPDIPPLALNFDGGTNPAHGTLTADGAMFYYLPNKDFSGTDSFEVVAFNGSMNSDPATITITVEPGKPAAIPQAVLVEFNTAKPITLNGTDSDDPPLALVNYTVTANPSHGILTGTAPNLNYTPNDGFNGKDSFQFTVTNSASVISASAAVSLTVESGAPVALDQTVKVPFNTTQTISLLGTDPNKPPLDVLEGIPEGLPTHGTLTTFDATTVLYTPKNGYHGPDSFQYSVINSDERASNLATVTIAVAAGKPTAISQTVYVPLDTPTEYTFMGSDPDIPALRLSYLFHGPSHGTLDFAESLAYLYKPNPGFIGVDTITFNATNSAGVTSDQGMITFRVVGKPTAIAQTLNVRYNTANSISLSAADPNDPPLTLTFDFPLRTLHGSLNGAADGNLTYTPDKNYAGSDSFQFTASNGVTRSDSATVTLNVVPSQPNFSSLPSATPNPAGVGQSVTFSAAAAANGDLVAYSWDFGDGSLDLSGPSVTHSYSAAGSYAATCTVTSTANLIDTAKVVVTVNAPVVGIGNDSDGDGFSDGFETAAGTDPNSAASTPTGAPITASRLQPLAISKAFIKVNFANTGSDTIMFTGTLTVPANFQSQGAKVYFDLGGVSKALMIDAKGNGTNGNDSVKLAIKSKKGVVQGTPTARYSVSFKNGTFAAILGERGLTGTNSPTQVTVTFTFIFNNIVYQKMQIMNYAVKGQVGTAQ